MPDSLRNRTIHALSWSFLESVGGQSLRFVIGIVLARLLFPEQFGLIGMLTIFMAVAQSFIDCGFGAALIQKLDPTPADTCSVFYFNILLGLAIAGVLCLVAPLIAAFYNQPILTPLVRALSLTFVINSLGLIQTSILQKQIRFKSLTKVSLIASGLSGIIGITMAAAGFGVWSLAVQMISSVFFRTLILWILSTWRPTLIFSFRSLREMFSFGSRMLASGLLHQIFENIYLLVIGKLFSAGDLGFFTRAKTMEEISSQTLSVTVGRVTFPVFSTIQDDPVRLKRGMRKALTTLVLVNCPVMIGLALIARPLVLVLLTDRWAECIPYLQLLCIAGLPSPFHVMNLNVLQAVGRSDLFFRLEIIKKVLTVINIAVTWRWGISAMVEGMVAISFIGIYLNSYYSGALIRYPVIEQLRDLFPYLIVAALMGMAVYAIGLLPFHEHWSILSIQIITGIASYLLLCRLFRLMAFMEIWRAGRNKICF